MTFYPEKVGHRKPVLTFLTLAPTLSVLEPLSRRFRLRAVTKLFVAIAIPLGLSSVADNRAFTTELPSSAAISTPLDVSGTIITLRGTRFCKSQCHLCDNGYWQYLSGSVSQGGVDKTCTTGDCVNCAETFEDVSNRNSVSDAIDVLERAVSIEDAKPLAQLLRGSSKLVYNARRHTLQLLGCDAKTIVANFPVTQSLQSVAMATARENNRVVGE